MDYKENKTMYLNLRNQALTGGKIFHKKQNLYIVATVSQRALKHICKEITDTIIGHNIKPYRSPHITLFNLIINPEHPDHVIFQDKKFYNKIKDIYAKTIADKNDPLILEALPAPRDYGFPGFWPKYFIKNYRQTNRQKILDFRQMVFALITKMIPGLKIKDSIDTNQVNYHVYLVDGQELFAESSYYDTWKPHLDFLNDQDIRRHNPALYQELDEHRSKDEKINILLDKINYISDTLTDINMSTQMRNITYAVDHVLQKKFKL
jgi:hypothetical protein